ncbi:carbohydrate ABC transporter permease [Deinococcus aquiradiocola]|uniref:Sugar ABC transporter permease n=1 Tax=Deinococcus aquiradiocola TaxID=393059 RepID=A0A917PI31_9DEIO|nr:sugar ABC transporter permease [Deinococcus aquiradiocola]GGJ79005.1 sugar ABC transporter permease [Deinococcus aquiradiocola]
MSVLSDDRQVSAGLTAPRKRRRQDLTFLFMALPAVILFFVFHTYPAVQGILYSFTNFKGFGNNYDFVGLRNYVQIFQDERAMAAYRFTFLFAILSTVLVNAVALVIAIGLNSNIRFRNTLRAIYFLPNILSVLIVGFIFNYLFANLVPKIGAGLGIASLSKNILGDPHLAWIGIVFVAVWQAAAFNIILYLAGLQTIPYDLYEAADIDGAGPWQKFRNITFPMIAAFFTINMVLAMKAFLQVFDQIVALTGGGPGTSTESVSFLIYKGGFDGGQFAYQSANAVLFFIVLVVVSLLQTRFLHRREVEA